MENTVNNGENQAVLVPEKKNEDVVALAVKAVAEEIEIPVVVTEVEAAVEDKPVPPYKSYIRKGLSEMREYVLGEDLKGVSVASVDTPALGGMIARNPENHADQWYVAKEYFEANLEEVFVDDTNVAKEKTLHNSNASGAKKNVKDIVFWGDGDTFKLISKASSKAEGWMKSTKAMEIHGVGCVVQVTTQQGVHVSEALTFVPGARVHEYRADEKDEDLVTSRMIVKM